MTLRRNKIDDPFMAVYDPKKCIKPFLPVPAGWQIANGNADDVRVCGANFWQINYLVMANGDMYGTAPRNTSNLTYVGAYTCLHATLKLSRCRRAPSNEMLPHP
jgi:hypothetical protein